MYCFPRFHISHLHISPFRDALERLNFVGDPSLGDTRCETGSSTAIGSWKTQPRNCFERPLGAGAVACLSPLCGSGFALYLFVCCCEWPRLMICIPMVSVGKSQKIKSWFYASLFAPCVAMCLVHCCLLMMCSTGYYCIVLVLVQCTTQTITIPIIALCSAFAFQLCRIEGALADALPQWLVNVGRWALFSTESDVSCMQF